MTDSLWKTAWQFLTKFSTHLSNDSTTSLLYIYSREMRIYTQVFIPVLSIIAPNPNAPPQVNRYGNVVYLYNGILLRSEKEHTLDSPDIMDGSQSPVDIEKLDTKASVL